MSLRDQLTTGSSGRAGSAAQLRHKPSSGNKWNVPCRGYRVEDDENRRRATSNREGFPAYVADRLSAVKRRNWKAHFIWQENMYDPPLKLPVPKLINLLTDLKEERDVCAKNDWVLQPMVKIIGELETSFRKYPPIKVGTPDPYTLPKE